MNARVNPIASSRPTPANGRRIPSGTDAMSFDLDLQILEYEHTAAAIACPETENLLVNGDMNAAIRISRTVRRRRGSTLPPIRTSHAFLAEGKAATNHFARVWGGGANGRTADVVLFSASSV